MSSRQGIEAIGQGRFCKKQGSKTLIVDWQTFHSKLGICEIMDSSIPVEQMCDRALWVVDRVKGMYNQSIAVYDDSFREKLLREKAITDAMVTALEEGEFIVYLQPKYSLNNNRIVGAEALVRWIHPGMGDLCSLE
ncbi:MAG: EAL domain-containing protein [Enterocloster sp.]